MMRGAQTQHLTDAEFSDLLAGELPEGAARVHLAVCDYCRGELESVRESLSSFTGLSTRWAHAAAPARVPVPSRWALGLGSIPSWSTGLAVTAFTGLLVFSLGPVGHPSPHATPASAAAAVAPSNTELAQDNRLMLSIDQELSYGDQSGTPTSAMHTGAHRAERHGRDPVMN